MQLAATMTTAQKPGQQQLAAPYRSLDRGTALARRIIGNHALVPLELLPSDVALVLIFEQNIPFGHWATHPTPHALAAFLDAHLARRPPEGIGAGMVIAASRRSKPGRLMPPPERPISSSMTSTAAQP